MQPHPRRAARPAALRAPLAALALAALGSAATVGSLLAPDSGAPFATFLDPARPGERLALGLDEYGRHLVRLYGRRDAEDLIYLRLMEREAERLGIALSEGEVAEAVQAQWQAMLDQRYGGNEAAMLAELERSGFEPSALQSQWRFHTERQRLEGLVAVATRELDEASLLRRFELDYGRDGVRVVVRHVFFNRARMQADLIRAGRRPDSLTPERLDRLIEQRLGELRAEIEAGAPFAEVAARETHDLAGRQSGGLIENYNYERFGDELAAAVRAAEVGQVFGPLAGVTGWHLGLVESRTVTRFEDVRDELRAALEEEEASGPERNLLRRRLLDAAELRFVE